MRRLVALRWIAVLGILSSGCQKPYFITEMDYAYYNRVSGDYDRQQYGDAPLPSNVVPRSVRDPAGKEKWKLSLEQAQIVALSSNKQIAFLGYQPGEAATNIDTILSDFDAVFGMGFGWARQDRQDPSGFNVFGTGLRAFRQDNFGRTNPFFPYGANATNGGSASAIEAGIASSFTGSPGNDMISLSKRNAAGGLTSIAYNVDYQKSFPNTTFTQVNPFWRSELDIQIQQPLLQGAGVEYNRAPILVARANHDRSIKDFQANVHTLLRDVETAYWQLYFTYVDLNSRETGMKQALTTWQKEKNKQEVGTGAVPDVAQAREQYEFFRAARLQALSRVLSADRALRLLLGLPPDDGREIIPSDEPTIAEYAPNWDVAVLETMDNRPELAGQRLSVRVAELRVFHQKNGLLPDLTVVGRYTITGLDDEFDQSLDRLTDNKFNDWGLGVPLARPLGERAAHADVRRSQLVLGRERATLKNLEHTFIHNLHEAYQNIVTNYDLIQVQKDRREAAAQQLKAREEFYRQGKTTIDVLLQAQTTFADALRDEGQAIVAYNQSLVQWEFVKGTILANDNVVLAEEQLSLVKDKLIRNRARQLENSIPIRIHPGDRVHGDSLPPADNSGPLYPEHLFDSDGGASRSSGAIESIAPVEVAPTTSDASPKPGLGQVLGEKVSKTFKPSSEPVVRGAEANATPKPGFAESIGQKASKLFKGSSSAAIKTGKTDPLPPGAEPNLTPVSAQVIPTASPRSSK